MFCTWLLRIQLMVQSQPWVHRVPSSQLAPWREILQDEAIRAVELSVLVDGMATPLHRLSPKLYRVADDVPDWLLQAAGRSHRFGNRQLPLSSKYLWLRLSARTSATPAQNGTTAVNLTVCSDLSTKLSHDVRPEMPKVFLQKVNSISNWNFPFPFLSNNLIVHQDACG